MRLSLITSFFFVFRANAGWIDEDTPLDKRVTTSLIDGSEYQLVMSDEFNVPGRTFKDGHDTTWTSLDKSDDDSSSAGGGSLHFYNSSMISTQNGLLKIKSNLEQNQWVHYDPIKREYKQVKKYFQSGMLQSWNKFCFTGGILEVDVIFPGDPYIGGLWPAIWLLGNLGRATYESSTNNIWPWSYNQCDRKYQQAQEISACNAQNHFGLKPFQGRGATEIDLIEVMTGPDKNILPGTDPGVAYPYADMTLQVAPGVTENRPQSGKLPNRNITKTDSGFTEWLAQVWYDGLEVNSEKHANTTLNPYFYGTYLGETKPEEPVSRSKKQVFQADAVGAMYQLNPYHFQRLHTFRLEWQPGPGGRLDWFTKQYPYNGEAPDSEWVRTFTIKDESLENLTGAQIPLEPSYLILNTGISSTWGFPYNIPDSCPKCYDCSNVTCACSFHPGFCNMMKDGDVTMSIDYVRVYQTSNHSAHVGQPHSLGCDTIEYPTREFIKGREYRYMRPPPHGYEDTGPLKDKIQNGGGNCTSHKDCGGVGSGAQVERGECITGTFSRGFFSQSVYGSRCSCNDGYTGPNCLSIDHEDDTPGAWDLRKASMGMLTNPPNPRIPTSLVVIISTSLIGLVSVLVISVANKKREVMAIRKGYSSIPGVS